MSPSSPTEVGAIVHDAHERGVVRLALLERLSTPLPREALAASPRGQAARLRQRELEAEVEQACHHALDLRLRAERAAMEAAVLGEEGAAVAALVGRLTETDGHARGALRDAVAILSELTGLFTQLADALSRLAGLAEAEAADLEASLPARAAQAVHGDLLAHVRPDEGAVRRLDLVDHRGPMLQPGQVDRLRHELDLLGAGAGPAWRAAEAEVSRALGDLVARWRAQRDG